MKLPGRHTGKMDSKLQTDRKTGLPYILCFYDRERCNWDESISNALKKFNMPRGKTAIVCKPIKLPTNDGNKNVQEDEIVSLNKRLI